MTYEPEQVRLATALRDLECTVDRIEALAKKDWPVRVECSHIRALIAALRKEPPPTKAAPLRKLAIVGRYEDSPSLRPSEEEIQEKYLDATAPRPECEAEKGEVPDAG